AALVQPLLRLLGDDRAEIEKIADLVERPREPNRDGDALQRLELGPALPLQRRHDRRLHRVVELLAADVDVARAADAEQRRLEREVVVVRDAVRDPEARRQLAEVGLLLGLARALAAAAAERRLRAPDRLRDVDAADRA